MPQRGEGCLPALHSFQSLPLRPQTAPAAASAPRLVAQPPALHSTVPHAAAGRQTWLRQPLSWGLRQCRPTSARSWRSRAWRPLQQAAVCQRCGTQMQLAALCRRRQLVKRMALPLQQTAACRAGGPPAWVQCTNVPSGGTQRVCWSGHAASMRTCQGTQHSPGVRHGRSAALVCLAANDLASLGCRARVQAEG